MSRPILTLTSDFGRDGPYVAAMKGVALGFVPDVQIVDVSHSIAPQNVLEGAFVLAGLADSFPSGTVHLAVVDPGVGTERRLLAVSVADQWFVAPDNGLLSGVVRGREVVIHSAEFLLCRAVKTANTVGALQWSGRRRRVPSRPKEVNVLG